ncbi:hypothetical protein VPH35_129214 [Triticum aestivum]
MRSRGATDGGAATTTSLLRLRSTWHLFSSQSSHLGVQQLRGQSLLYKRSTANMEAYVCSSSAAAMAGDLEGVARVYEHVEPLMRFARAEQVEEELEASVGLLDACAAARDGLRSMRASAFDLEVALRRGDAATAEIAARAYTLLARKARADVKRQQRHRRISPCQAGESGGRSLEEARRVTVAVLERVVMALSRRVAVSAGPSRWSTCIAARAFRKTTRVACVDAEKTTTTVLPSLALRKDSTASRAQRELRALGDTIQQLEEGLELLFRRLVQCRAFLLDMCSS